MDEKKWIEILEEFKKGNIDTKEIIQLIKKLPYENIDFAKIDHHRFIRQGLPEVIFAEGKSVSQVVKIFSKMKEVPGNILITRANEKIYNELLKIEKDIIFDEKAKCIGFFKQEPEKIKGGISIVTAGTSDIFVAEEAKFTAKFFGNKVSTFYDVGVAGIYRLIKNIDEIKKSNVIIAIAGMEGALASVIGGLVDKIVIAVPTDVGYGTNFGGLTALFGMLNSCSPNVVVVNVNNGFGAAYSATLINRSCGKIE